MPNWCENTLTIKGTKEQIVDFNKEIASAGINTVDKSPKNKAIYSINGTKVGYDFDLLPKGIYIIGGKKVAK